MIRARLLGVSVLFGCACGAPATQTPPPSAVPAVAAEYEVHEWGLIRAAPGDTLNVGAAAPPITFVPLAVEKPLLYFHASAPLTLAAVDVTIPDGTIAEAWPVVPMGQTLRWPSVAIDPSGCTPTALPTASEPPCDGLPPGESCESASLASVRTSDAACVSVSGTSERFLFYRARATSFTPPLLFENFIGSTSGDMRVTNESDVEIPGVLVRIRSTAGWTQTLTATPPAPHATVVVGTDFSAAAAAIEDRPVETPPAEELPPLPITTPGREGLRASMRTLGLSDPEIEAFLAAWNDALFGRRGEMAVERTPAPVDSFVYFLPETLDDRLAQLSFDPPPRAVHRAIAVWSFVPLGGSSH